MLPGVSGAPVTIHSAPEVKTCRCWPEKTPRMAFTWSETRPNSIAWSSSPVPRSKLNRSPVRDSQSRFGRSREPPSTSRSWWKQSVTGQPRTAEKAASSQSVVAAVPDSVSSTVAVACVALATAVTSSLPAAEAEAHAGMAGLEHGGGGGQRHRAAGGGGGQRGIGEAVEGLAQETPGRHGPGGVAGPGDALRHHVRMAEQQRVGALREGELRQHRRGPGAGHLRHLAHRR